MKILELKNAITNRKIHRTDLIAEWKASELKDRSTEITQSEQQKKY